MTPELEAYAVAQDGVHALPRPIQPPFAKKVVEDGLPRRQVVRQQTLRNQGAPTAHEVEDRVEDAAQRMAAADGGAGGRSVVPLGILQQCHPTWYQAATTARADAIRRR